MSHLPPSLPALINFTQRLVQAQSLTGAEQTAVEVLAAEMRALNFDKIVVDPAGSLIGIIEGSQPGPTLLLDGHCDTVPANPADWQHDPWGGQVEGGRMFGRGTADMKASLAAMVHAAGSLDRGALRGRVAVSATVAEEVSEGGALRLVMDELHPDAVVIGEATELNLNRGGRGRAEIEVTTFGRSAHSSSPQAGRCAVTDMLRVVQSLQALPLGVHAELGPASLVLTDIISEPYPGRSVIPYRCRATFDRRLLPEDRVPSVLAEVNQRPGLDDVQYQARLAGLDESTYTGYQLRGDKFFPAWIYPESHPFVQTALRGLQSAGLQPSIGCYRFCTNAAYSAGIAGIPTIGFGIGREEDAHITDESILVEDLLSAARGYQGIITAFLNQLS